MANWVQLPSQQQGYDIRRSSHALAVVGDRAFIFGGEVKPREPVDNVLYPYNLALRQWEAPVKPTEEAPEPRVGTQMATIGSMLYVFGGRGGKDMQALSPEVYQFDTETSKWTRLTLDGQYPEARSFHAMTASETDLYVFGGCPASGRLSDLWSFNPITSTWARKAQVDLSGRGGAALAYHQGKIWLHGGFNGQELDDLRVYDIASDTWSTPIVAPGPSPAPRSVHAMVPVDDHRLVVLYGERDPSTIGHEGAGKFWDDVWILSIDKDQVTWTKVHVSGPSEGSTVSSLAPVKPKDRGWFQAAAWKGKVVLSGGLDDENARLDDLFVLQEL